MATDLATLAIKVDNGDVIKTTTSLNSMEVAGAKAEASTGRLTRRMALLEIQAREMDAEMSKNATTIGRLRGAMESAEKAVPGLTHALEALSVAAAIGFIGHKTIEETELAQAAMAQLEAAVKATGGAAGRTVAQLDELSIALQKQTTYSDEAVKGAEAILLTFNKVKGDEFDRATRAVTDLATRMGRDLPDAALQVGKALQDPVEGLQALQRLGVRFSASQKEVIRDLVDTGNAAQAQQMILEKLESTFGGSAAAARDTLGGALAALSNAWGDLFEVTKGGTQGTVDGLNAITHALESSGISMNKILKDATVDFETMRASIEKVREIMALPIGPGFIQQARNIIQRIDFDLSVKIAELNKPAKVAPAGPGAGAGTNELTETAKKFAELVAQRDAEIAKLASLNAAYRESAVTLSLLNVQYDAQAKKIENAQGHTARETAILNARTDALTKQKEAQILLNSALEQERKLQAARDQNTGAIEAALHARDRADLTAPDAEIQAIRDRADEEVAAARRAHDQKQGLRADEQATEDALYRERVANIRNTSALEIDTIKRTRQAATDTNVSNTVRDTDAQTAAILAMTAAELQGGKAAEQMSVYLAGQDAVTRALNDATANGTTLTDAQTEALRRSAEASEQARINAEKLRAVFQEVNGAVNQFFTDAFNRKDPIPALKERIKAEVIAGLSAAVSRPLTVVFGKILGIEIPADKQTRAAKLMNEAADKQLQAAQVMLGGSPDVATQRYVDQFAPRPPATTSTTGTVARTPQPSVLAQIEAHLPSSVAHAIESVKAQIAPALAGFGVGQGVAYGLYSQSHGAAGNYARGALGGAAAGALAGSAFGPVGAVVGGIAGLIGGILGIGSASKEAAKQTAELRKALALTMDGLRAEVGKDALAANIAQVQANRETLRKQIEDAYSGGGRNSDTVKERNRQLAELNALEDERIRQLKEEAATIVARQQEDYRVRELRAEGKTQEADALAFQESQQREREDLVRSFGPVVDAQESATLAALDAAQAAEKQAFETGKNTEAINALTTSVRGGPSGFKLSGYIQEFAKGRDYPGQWQIPTPLVPPMSPLNPQTTLPTSSTSTGKVATPPIVLNNPVFQFPNIVDGPKAAKAFLAELDKTVASTGGPNTTRAVALNKMVVT